MVLSSPAAKDLAAELINRFDLEVTVHDDVVRFEHANAHELVGQMAEFPTDKIQALTVSKPTLEDVFLRRTGHGLWEGGG